MAQYITRIRTDTGDHQIDYKSLANLPTTDKTLKLPDKSADANIVGNEINRLDKSINQLTLGLSKKAETATYTGSLLANSWINESAYYIQTITVDGILAADTPFVDIDLSNVSDYLSIMECWTLVGRVTATADNTIVAYCYEDKPEDDIPIILKVIR